MNGNQYNKFVSISSTYFLNSIDIFLPRISLLTWPENLGRNSYFYTNYLFNILIDFYTSVQPSLIIRVFLSDLNFLVSSFSYSLVLIGIKHEQMYVLILHGNSEG